jgi:hypothetical protein
VKQLRLSFDARQRRIERPIGRPRVTKLVVACWSCGKELEKYPFEVKDAHTRRFRCSPCYQAAKRHGLKPRHLGYELERMHNGQPVRVGGDGYALIYEPTFSSGRRKRPKLKKFWHPEHRVVAARMLGRPLRRGEDVHHINGIKLDNHPANFQVVSRRTHRQIHNDEVSAKLRRLVEYERRFGSLDVVIPDALADEAGRLTAHLNTRKES